MSVREWGLLAYEATRARALPLGLDEATSANSSVRFKDFGCLSVGLRESGFIRFQHLHEQLQVVNAFQSSGDLQ